MEEVPTQISLVDHSWKTDFAGTTISYSEGTLSCANFNKNEQFILEHEIQFIKTLPRFDDYLHIDVFRGVIIGSIYRIFDQCTYVKDFYTGCNLLFKELEILLYTAEIIQQAIRRLYTTDSWPQHKTHLLSLVDGIFLRSAP